MKVESREEIFHASGIPHVVIGSRLMLKLFPTDEHIQRRCKPTADYDVLVEAIDDETVKYFKSKYGTKTELHVIDPLWSYFKDNAHWNWADVLLTLKASHVSWDKVHKKKTFLDLYLLSIRGAQVIEPLFYQLHDYWTKKFGEVWRADFEKESSEFFDDAVSRENVHDELHELVKFFDKPAFKYLQEEGQTTVWVCPEKFYTGTEELRQAVVIEESRALAIERILLHNPKASQYAAYLQYMEGLVDRLAPLWMVVYIVNNFHIFVNKKEKYYDI